MAAVSGAHVATVLTPPSSSHGQQNSWSFSNPPQNQNFPQPAKQTQTSEYLGHEQKQRPPLESHDTFGTRPVLLDKRTNTSDPSRTARVGEGGYLAPARFNTLNRKDSSVSDAASAPDSLLDLYGTPSANRSGGNSMDLKDGTRNGEAYGSVEDLERSRWIHRDKLAQIESQELRAAGFTLPRSRSMSKGRRDRSRDPGGNEPGRNEQLGQKKLQRVGSIPTEVLDSQQDDSWDLRLPEETAADGGDWYTDYASGQKGASRIPLLKTSPLPIPLDYIERDAPTQRNVSGAKDTPEDGIFYEATRQRSKSIQVMEDAEASPTPAKRLVSDTSPVKKTKGPAQRKTSAPTNRTPTTQQRPRTRSRPKEGSISRPNTRSGELNHMGSIKRPEGDPPWLASMYKPDPRLPPDQQLLPTVAKRLQQEQWEKEGKFGNAYDKEFRPLNNDEIPQPEAAQTAEQVLEIRDEERVEWPLRAPKSPTASFRRPTTPKGPSYSTTPRIDTLHSPLQSPRIPGASMQAMQLSEPPTLPEEKMKAKRGCCVVM